MHVSSDGGRNFERVGSAHKHVDEHALWINPDNPDHLITGNDGGIYDSFDGGANWRHVENLPITQFYRATPDNAEPFYNVYGGTQDNATLGAPSRTTKTQGIANSDWFVTIGGDGFKTQIDPNNPDIVYSQLQYGMLARFDKESVERVLITPMPGADENNYKWNWNSASSSARTRRSGCTTPPRRSSAPTTAATPGAGSVPTSRAISIAMNWT